MKSSPTAASQISRAVTRKRDLQTSTSAPPFDYHADVEDLAAPWRKWMRKRATCSEVALARQRRNSKGSAVASESQSASKCGWGRFLPGGGRVASPLVLECARLSRDKHDSKDERSAVMSSPSGWFALCRSGVTAPLADGESLPYSKR